MRVIHAVAAFALLATVAPRLGAQDTPPAPPESPAPDSSPERLNRRLFVGRDLQVLGIFAGATVLMFPLDERLASTVRDDRLQANQNLKRMSAGFRYFGAQGPYLIGGGMYLVGRLARVPRAAHLGLHGTEALVVGQVVAATLKVILGRARPYVSSDTNPRSFALGRGFQNGDFKSFPSGHSTSAFAAAAAVTAETSEWWPQTRWVIGPILYGGAAMVGLSRMYDDKHWASDVVMGAAVGTFAGLKTVRFNHSRAGNRLDRLLLGESADAARLDIRPGVDGSLLIGPRISW